MIGKITSTNSHVLRNYFTGVTDIAVDPGSGIAGTTYIQHEPSSSIAGFLTDIGAHYYPSPTTSAASCTPTVGHRSRVVLSKPMSRGRHRIVLPDDGCRATGW